MNTVYIQMENGHRDQVAFDRELSPVEVVGLLGQRLYAGQTRVEWVETILGGKRFVASRDLGLSDLRERFMSGEWHPDMGKLSPAGCRDAAFFAHGAAFPLAGNASLPGGPEEALARLMAGEWDNEAELPAVLAGNQESEVFQFRFLARTGLDGMLPLFGRDSTGRNTETPTRSGVRLEFDYARGRMRPEGTAWVIAFASGRSVSGEEVQSLFPEVAWFPTVAQPGDLVRVDRDKNLMADPQGFGSWEAFEAAADAAGLELDQHPGNDREGWRVVAVSPRTGPNRPEGEDGPPPPPDPALERVWID